MLCGCKMGCVFVLFVYIFAVDLIFWAKWPLPSWATDHEYYPGQARQRVSAQRQHGPQLCPQHDHVQPFTSSHQLHTTHLAAGGDWCTARDGPEEREGFSGAWWRFSAQHGHKAGEVHWAWLPHPTVWNRLRDRRRKEFRHAGHFTWKSPEHASAWCQHQQCKFREAEDGIELYLWALAYLCVCGWSKFFCMVIWSLDIPSMLKVLYKILLSAFVLSLCAPSSLVVFLLWQQLPGRLGKDPKDSTHRKGRRANGEGTEGRGRRKRGDSTKVCVCLFIYLFSLSDLFNLKLMWKEYMISDTNGLVSSCLFCSVNDAGWGGRTAFSQLQATHMWTLQRRLPQLLPPAQTCAHPHRWETCHDQPNAQAAPEDVFVL